MGEDSVNLQKSGSFSFPSFKSFPNQAKPLQVQSTEQTNPKPRKKRKKHKLDQLEIFAAPAVENSTDYYFDTEGNQKTVKYQELRNEFVPIYKKKTMKLLGTHFTVKKEGHRLFIFKKMQQVQPRTKYRMFRHAMNACRIPMTLNSGSAPDFNSDFIPVENNLIIHNETAPDTSEIEFQQKSAIFTQILDQDPTNIDKWLEFVRFQGLLSTYAMNQTKQSVKNRIITKKLAILEKALKFNPESDEILAVYMDEIEKVEDNPTILQKWDELLDEHPTSFLLWKKYLDFRLSNPDSFQFGEILRLFEECMECLQLVENEHQRDAMLLHIFNRVCIFLRQTGYIERAVACFQGLIELNLYCPLELAKYTTSQRIEIFQEFWDSECPRFGDVGSVGWRYTGQINNVEGASFNPKNESSNSISIDDKSDKYTKWYQEELDASHRNWLPLRNSIQDNIDDPYQTILYDDIRGFMFELKTMKAHKLLVGTFLSFLGTSFGNIRSSESIYIQDSFLHDELCNSHLIKRFITGETGISVNFPAFYSPVTPTSLHGDNMIWPNVFSQEDLIALAETGDGKLDFIRRVLDQGQVFFENCVVAKSFILWLDFLQNPKKADSVAKKILKSEPMNLPLWNIYANFCNKIAGSEKAIQILKTTVGMFQSFPSEYWLGNERLYSTLAEIEVFEGKTKNAISTIVGLSTCSPIILDENDYSASKIKKTKEILLKKLQSQLNVIKSNSSFDSYSDQMETFLAIFSSYSLLECLVGNLDSAGEPIFAVIKNIEEKTLLHELALESICRVIVTYIHSGVAYKPAIIREVLELALTAFPHNSLFLTLYGWSEGKAKLDNRVRRFIKERIESHPSHTLWLFAIWTEIHQRSTANRQVIRSLLNDALNSSSGRTLQLWILAIEFEISENNFEAAKSWFYQAITVCPWSKQLYMYPFFKLRSAFSPEELEDLKGTMEDNEFRIRIPMPSL